MNPVKSSQSSAQRPISMSESLLRIAGALLLVLPFVPTEALYGDSPEIKGAFTPYQWFLGLLILFTFSAILAQPLGLPLAKLGRRVLAKIITIKQGLFLASALGLEIILLCLSSAFVFDHKPLLVDEVIQLFQAKIFAAGLWKAPLPALPQFFYTQHMIFDPSGWYSQYPPGHSAVLALGILIGAAWIVPVILSVVAAFAFYKFAQEAYGDDNARLMLLCLIFCPFFIFMGSSFMNHVSAICFISLALWAFARWERDGNKTAIFCVGLALGAAFLSRPLCAITAGAVFAFWGLPGILRNRLFGDALIGGIGFAVFAALFFLFNSITTGDPFLPGYIKLWGESHGMGFHLSPFGESHTPAAGLAKQVINLTILNEYLFESAVPSCIFMALLFVLPSEKNQWDRRLLALFFAFPAMYFFYWHRDSYLGPRFIYVSLLAAIPLTVRGISLTAALLNQPTSRAAAYKPSLVFGFFALAFFLYSAFAGIPYRFHNYATGFRSMKVDIVKEAHQAGIESGLIFTPVSFGSRLISQIRAAGLPAAETEQAYRTTDHCLLFELIQRARRTGMTVEQIEAEIARLRRFAVTKFPKANGDRTLRLRPDIRPDDLCLAEIEYDHLGYSLFLPHLIADSPTLSPPFVVATDMRRENRKLIEKYPNLKPYIYRKGNFIPIEQRDNIEQQDDAAE